MKRKTNLFYTTEEDTRFITFSNYTESMTGNFLSTDTKLYPSKFLCMNIPLLDKIDNDTISDFSVIIQNQKTIKNIITLAYIVGYVNQNGDKKLSSTIYNDDIVKKILISFDTVCTEDDVVILNCDNLIGNYNYVDIYNKNIVIYGNYYYDDISAERSINDVTKYVIDYNEDESSLDLRIKFINNIVASYENKLAFLRDYLLSNNKNPENVLTPLYYLLESIEKYDSQATLVFNSDITEQDYNGTYADTICVINSNDAQVCNIVKSNSILDKIVEYPSTYVYSTSYLYGWTLTQKNIVDDIEEYSYVWNGPDYYKNISPIFDKIEDTTYEYKLNSKITNIEYRDADMSTVSNITFNCIIPLYNITNANYNTSNNLISVNTKTIDNITWTYWNANYTYNVPLGIWFSGDEPVKLKKDSLTGMSPSWSLVLSSQFKPFPYSSYMPDETTNTNNANAFETFSQILIRQNNILECINDFTVSLNDFNKRLANLETKMNWAGTTYNLDNMHVEMLSFENKINKQIDNIKDICYSYLSTNTWQYYNI